MAFEDTHAAAVGNGRVVVAVIFEDNIVEEALEVKGLLGADHIENCIFLDKRECLACKSSAEHSNCISSLTILDGFLGVAGETVGP